MWKLQATATINLKIPLLNTDGTPATGETTGLFTTTITPAGSGLTGGTDYTEATFTEPNSDGIYNVSFPLTAPTKAFTLEDQSNPYSVTLDSTTVDVDPMTIDVWITSLYPWEVSKESTLSTHETARATMETALTTEHGLLQNGIDNIEGGVLRIQTSLVDQVLVPSGNNWVKVVVLVNDNLGALFDPADIVDPSGSPIYNGVGAKFSDIDDDQVIMYKDDIGTPLDQVNLCAHAPQDNKPQILERDAHGLYYYWMNATATGNVLPVGQLRTLFALFDITQAAATYSGTSPFLIQDTDPTSHLHILFSVNILAEAGITEKLNTIIADVQHATYGLSAIQVLIDALDTSTEMQARFDQIKGAGWTDETLKALSEFVDDLETRLTQVRADGMPPATMSRV